MDTKNLTPLSGRWPEDSAQYSARGLADTTAYIKAVVDRTAPSPLSDALSINKTDQAAIAAFAADNGMAYAERVTENIGITQRTADWHHGAAWVGGIVPVLVHEVSGTIAGLPTKFCLSYKDFGTPDSTELVRQSVIRVSLPKLFPQLVLDSNKNDRSHGSSINASFHADQKLTLEGNFESYFDFFSPRGLQVDALTVLAPNFMEILMTSAVDFDVEFYGRELVLITNQPLFTPQVIAAAEQALQTQLTYLNQLMKSWDYQPNHQPFDMLERSTVSGSVLKIGSYRIQPALAFGLFFAVFFLLPLLLAVLL